MPFQRLRISRASTATACAGAIAGLITGCDSATDESMNASVPAARQTEQCAAAGGYEFVCGPMNAEDLVVVPGTRWVIASGMAPGAPIYLVDSQSRSWSGIYPADTARVRHDAATYPACPDAPDPGDFVTHGLNLRRHADGRTMLYAVSHGAREAVEAFEIDTSADTPSLTWVGCAPMPEGLEANSAASFADGSLVATVLIHPGSTFEDSVAGRPTGAVYAWSPGDDEFTLIEGTALPGNNGIEVSADGTEFFVVSSGLLTVVAFENANPSRQLRTTVPLEIVPDNVHMAPDGRLVTAGTVMDEPACGDFPSPAEFDIEAYAQCPRGFIAYAIDPESMRAEVLERGSATPSFSNATMAVEVGDEVWVGTFNGDRIAIVP